MSRSTLANAEENLHRVAPALERAKSFDELHELVRETIAPIRGVGELAVYDIALRLGAYRRLEPENVYVHAGTRIGVRALGMKATDAVVSTSALPKPLRALRPREVEDFLCIYKDVLREVSSQRREQQSCAPLSDAASCV